MSWTKIIGAACVLSLSTLSGAAWGQTTTTEDSAEAKTSMLTLEGDTALWSVAIRADQTAAFEQVMTRLQEALTHSDDPLRRQQAEGWSVVRLETPLPDGAAVYVHVIRPVVAGANYSIMQILYDEFPDERRALYDLYRGAFDRNLSLATGSLAIDLARPAAPVVATARN